MYWVKKGAFCGFMSMMMLGTSVFAKEYKASIAKIPSAVYMLELLKAMGDVSGNKIEATIQPFAKSMADVQEKKVDFHLPFIQPPQASNSGKDFDYSTEAVFYTNFVLYSNKSKNIDKAKLKDYKIETDSSHTQLFDFPVIPSTSIVDSLRKVDSGAIDGFIFAEPSTDKVLKGAELKNIRRDFYKRYETKAILPKGGNGGETDKMISDTLAKLKSQGRYDKIMGPINMPYDNWQPK